MHPEAGEFYGCALSYSLETATWANRWETRRLQELARTETAPDPSEHPNEEPVRRLVLNALLLLTHYELDPILVEDAPLIGKAKVEGKHVLAELARARFLSEMLKRKAFRRVKPLYEAGEEETVGTQRHVTGESTGIKYRAHWVRGHFRRIRFRPKLSQSRLTWILPYPTGEFRHEQQSMS
jgi:hypothetical protein